MGACHSEWGVCWGKGKCRTPWPREGGVGGKPRCGYIKIDFLEEAALKLRLEFNQGKCGRNVLGKGGSPRVRKWREGMTLSRDKNGQEEWIWGQDLIT